MKRYVILGAMIWYCKAMPPVKQVRFANDPGYCNLAHQIYERSEPLIFDICVSCGSCPVAAGASISLCPEASLWCHAGITSVTFFAFLSSWACTPFPEGSASEQLVTKIKNDTHNLFRKNTKAKRE